MLNYKHIIRMKVSLLQNLPETGGREVKYSLKALQWITAEMQQTGFSIPSNWIYSISRSLRCLRVSQYILFSAHGLASTADLCIGDFPSAEPLAWMSHLREVQHISRRLSRTCSVSCALPVSLLKGKHCEQASRSYQDDVNKNTSNKNLLYYRCQHSLKKISKLQWSWFYCQSNSQRLFGETTLLFFFVGAVDRGNRCLSCSVDINFPGVLSSETAACLNRIALSGLKFTFVVTQSTPN